MRMSFKDMVLSCLENTLYCKIVATVYIAGILLIRKYMYFADHAIMYPILITFGVLFWLFGKDWNWFGTEDED